MSAVVVDPDAFYDCAQALAYGVHDVVSGALDTLVGTLDGCGAMAGSDEGGLAWAAQYDDAARTALSAGEDLDNALYNVVCLLERTGLNHAQADAASTPGGRLPAQRVHPLEGSFRLGAVRAAAGGSGSAPFGWSLVEHLVGYLWPNGHQDRLRSAARAWDSAAASLRSAAHAVDPIWNRISEQRAPEAYDAELVLTGMQNHLHDLAGAFSGLARACRELAHHIDVAHSDVESALVELTAESAGIELLGGAVSAFTFGAAEAPTQAVEASRIASVAARISGYLSSFVSAVRTVVAAVPALESVARGVSSAVEWLRNARLVSAEVVGVPGLRILRMESVARDGSAVARTGASATSLEGAAASDAAVVSESTLTGEAAAESELSISASGVDPETAVDLVESERLGGHPLARHAGKTDQYLKDRNIPFAGTFSNAETAQRATVSNVVQNRERVDLWLSNPGGPNRLTIRGALDPNAGRIFDRAHGRFIQPSSVVTRLERHGDGFYVVTTYPDL